MNNNGVYTEALSVGYAGKAIIKGIELSIENGKILTLIGPNGSGKSTILKSIVREIDKVDGLVYYLGKEDKSVSQTELAKELSMVMTGRPKAELMTCRDVVETGRYPYTGRFGRLLEVDKKAVDEAMELVGITDLSERAFGAISDGQKQRVMLARAICQEPKILVLDEPTSYLDIRYKLEILTTIRRLTKEKDMAVVMSLHELDIAKSISDVIACIDGDHIGKIGRPDEIFSNGYIQKLYGIDEKAFCEETGMLIL